MDKISKLIIDRFEEDKAVCETETQEMIIVERKYIPTDAIEGSMIALKDNDQYVLLDNQNERNRIKEKMNRLMNGGSDETNS